MEKLLLTILFVAISLAPLLSAGDDDSKEKPRYGKKINLREAMGFKKGQQWSGTSSRTSLLKGGAGYLKVEGFYESDVRFTDTFVDAHLLCVRERQGDEPYSQLALVRGRWLSTEARVCHQEKHRQDASTPHRTPGLGSITQVGLRT